MNRLDFIFAAMLLVGGMASSAAQTSADDDLPPTLAPSEQCPRDKMPKIANGRLGPLRVGRSVEDSDFVFAIGFQIPVLCELNHKSQGKGGLFCEKGGQWVLKTKCVKENTRVTCSKKSLPKIANGRYAKLGARGRNTEDDEDDFTFPSGTRLAITCYKKFKEDGALKGKGGVQCGQDGKWYQLSQCAPKVVLCSQAPTAPLNGRLGEFVPKSQISVKSKPQAGDKFKVECNTGFTMTGNAHVTCEASGKWTQSGECKPVQCLESATISNGVVAMGKPGPFFVGDERKVICRSGHFETSEGVIRCNHDGTWIIGTKCIPDRCSRKELPNVDFGEYAQVSRDQSASKSIEAGNTNDVEEGYNFPVGTVLPIFCQRGYKVKVLKSQRKPGVHCVKGAKWWVNVQCEKIPLFCPPLETPPNARLAVIGGRSSEMPVPAGQKIKATCLPGYKRFGNDFYFCTDEGKWVPADQCEAIRCSKVPPPEILGNARIAVPAGRSNEDQEYLAGRTYYVRCEPGFYESSNGRLRCSLDGKWVNETQCLPMQCSEQSWSSIIGQGRLADVPLGRSTDDFKIQAGKTARVKCNDGSESKLVCTLDGKLIGKKCPAVCSSAPKLPPHAKLLVPAVPLPAKLGLRVLFDCDASSEPSTGGIGPYFLECRGRYWAPIVPKGFKCQKVAPRPFCPNGEIPRIPNGQLADLNKGLNDNDKGEVDEEQEGAKKDEDFEWPIRSKVPIRCDKGFVAVNARTGRLIEKGSKTGLYCNKYGRWKMLTKCLDPTTLTGDRENDAKEKPTELTRNTPIQFSATLAPKTADNDWDV